MKKILLFFMFFVSLFPFSCLWAETTVDRVVIFNDYYNFGRYSNGYFFGIGSHLLYLLGVDNDSWHLGWDANATNVNERVLVIGRLEGYSINGVANLIFEDSKEKPLIFINRNYCYILGEKLHIVDITNPFKPKLISEIPLSSLAVDAEISGNFIYVFEVEKMEYESNNKIKDPLKGYWGLEIIDITDPHNPKIVGNSNYLNDYGYSPLSFVDNSAATEISVYGNYAICASGQKLAIFNIAYVNTPLLENVIDVGKYVYKMKIKDTTLFLITSSSLGCSKEEDVYLTVYDVRNPLNPKFLTEIPIGSTNGFFGCYEYLGIRVFVYKDLLFISLPSEVKILDISKPSEPHLEFSENTIIDSNTPFDNYTFPVSGGVFFYAGDKILRIRDVSNSPYIFHVEEGWNLKGSSHRIELQEDLLPFENSTIIWSWKDNNWYVWSKNSEFVELMKKFGMSRLDEIEENQGFWIYSPSESTYLISNNSTDTLETMSIDLSKGWNLVGTSSVIDTEVFKDPDILYLWKWTGNSWLFWSPNPLLSSMAEVYYGIKTFSWILPGEGVWVKSKVRKSISLEDVSISWLEIGI